MEDYMNASAPMKTLVFKRWVKLFWADKWFNRPGLYIWAFSNNRRIIPISKRFL